MTYFSILLTAIQVRGVQIFAKGEGNQIAQTDPDQLPPQLSERPAFEGLVGGNPLPRWMEDVGVR